MPAAAGQKQESINPVKRRTLAQRWADITLRSKITGVTVLILSFGLLVAGVGTMSLLKPTLYASHDQELRQYRSNPTAALQQGADMHNPTQGDVINARGPNYVALYDSEGQLLADNNYAEIPEEFADSVMPSIEAIDTDLIPQEIDDFDIIEFKAEDGTAWRAVLVPLFDQETGSTDRTLLVASSTRVIENVMAQYITIFSGFGLAVILLGAALTRILVTATFEPLSEVERTAREIARGDFSKRIHVASPNTEVGHVGTSLNIMLDKIDESFKERQKTIEQMRRFIGDAGHELRTPLVSVRGYAEMYRLGMLQEQEQVDQAMGRVEKEAIRMTSLVEDLLSLARLDSKRELNMVPLDLNSLARDAALDAVAQAPDREIVAIECEQTPMALGDEHKVRQLMTNLLGNAIRHTDADSPIEIAVIATPDAARFEIRDHGEGVPEPIRQKIFDRFWRADTSRNRETGGSGLGLAIVSSIVAAHGGSVSVHDTEGGGATFRVDLPHAVGEEPVERQDATTVFQQNAAAVAAGGRRSGSRTRGRGSRSRRKENGEG